MWYFYLQAGQQSDAVRILSPFNVALALSVAHIRRFEEPVSNISQIIPRYNVIKQNELELTNIDLEIAKQCGKFLLFYKTFNWLYLLN